jgi:hypothetical protein
MRSKFTPALAAIAVALAITGATAAPIDSNLQSPAPPSTLVPQQGSSTSGFPAIGMHRENSLQANERVRSEQNRAWRGGLANEGAISHSAGAQQALISLPGTESNDNSFAALRAARQQDGSDRAVENQVFGARAAPDNIPSAAGK